MRDLLVGKIDDLIRRLEAVDQALNVEDSLTDDQMFSDSDLDHDALVIASFVNDIAKETSDDDLSDKCEKMLLLAKRLYQERMDSYRAEFEWTQRRIKEDGYNALRSNYRFTPTMIGIFFGLHSSAVNKLLVEAGLQTKDQNGHVATALGLEYMHSPTTTGKSRVGVSWSKSVIPFLAEKFSLEYKVEL